MSDSPANPPPPSSPAGGDALRSKASPGNADTSPPEAASGANVSAGPKIPVMPPAPSRPAQNDEPLASEVASPPPSMPPPPKPPPPPSRGSGASGSDDRSPRPRRRRGLFARMRYNLGEIWTDNKILLVCSFFVFTFLVAFFWNDIFVLVRPGERAVIYRPFSQGTDIENTYNEGLQILAPWNRMYIYDVRVQQVADEFTVLSSDGLEVKINISIRFRPQREDLGRLHKDIGPEYVEKVVKPVAQSQFRFVLGQYKPEEIYTSQGFIVQTAKQGSLAEMADRFILLDDLLLKSVTLPPPVAAAIESKLKAQQLALEFNYRIETEAKEKERKRIEAEGIRTFQDIISSGGISDSYLRFRGIQATLELAKSPNSKIIVIGGGKDGLPLILDGRNDTLATPPLPVPAEAAPAP